MSKRGASWLNQVASGHGIESDGVSRILNFESILSTLPRLYDATLSTEHWTPALDIVAHHTDAKGAMLYAIGHEEDPYSVSTSNSFYAGKESIIEEYTSKYIQYDFEGMAVLDKTDLLQPVLDVDIWPDKGALFARKDMVFTRTNLGIMRRLYFNLNQHAFTNAGLILQFD